MLNLSHLICSLALIKYGQLVLQSELHYILGLGGVEEIVAETFFDQPTKSSNTRLGPLKFMTMTYIERHTRDT